MKTRPAALVLVLVPFLLAGCGDDEPTTASPKVSESPATSDSSSSPSPSPSPSFVPDLSDELIAKLPDEVPWADEGASVEYDDGSTGLLERTKAGLVLTVDTADGERLTGPVPDFEAEGGLSPELLQLDSGGVGYVAYQGGGEFARVALMVPWEGQLSIAGNGCFDIETNAYERCELS
jgi:hypothetical protein